MSRSEPCADLEEEVAALIVRQRHGEWTAEDQAALEHRLSTDPAFAERYRAAEESISALRAAADLPEMMRFREQAFAHARRSGARRWLGPHDSGSRWRWVAGIAASFVLAIVALQLSPWAYQPNHYRTGIGEQRILELEDHSRVTLDAQTRVVIRYTDESRTIELVEGQAQFAVAKDPTRPFRVKAGDHTIVALGTVFTVEFTDYTFHVAMVQGRVAVVPATPVVGFVAGTVGEGLTAPRLDPGVLELSAGEELKVGNDGRARVIANADIEAATAWRNGRVVFRTERLADAVRRMNRYSRVQLEIGDPALEDETISGVFEVGDTQGFIAGVQLALPVVASYGDGDKVRLSLQRESGPE